MVITLRLTFVTLLATAFTFSSAQDHHAHSKQQGSRPTNVEPQPFISHAARIAEALNFAGSSLSVSDQKKLKQLQQQKPSAQTVAEVQKIFDPYCLAIVNINAESRVKVDRGPAESKLTQAGWTIFLVKVYNDAGVTSSLVAESPNALLPIHPTSGTPKVLEKDIITPGQSLNRFLDLKMYTARPLSANLSGLKLEYAVLQVYSKDAGRREAEIGFNVGMGSQDIGFRNTIHILFDVKPSVKVRLNVSDDDGDPIMASFTITDSIDRGKGRFSNVYPLPSRRVAALDEYPDFFFQKQVYRSDGEYLSLAPGEYTVRVSRGPEYIPQTRKITIPRKDSASLNFKLKRWIDPSKLGWYSADHHVHAAGCSHYDSPEEGVPPRDMLRQAMGEDLDVSAVLTWGPSWYYQKRYFTGRDDSLSTRDHIMRYDVEVSGFPSSHSGHIVLLRIKEDDYPGTKTIEEWPSWTLPILKWAKDQGGVVGYAHSGWGLEPVQPTNEIPNYILPKMDGIGANEYVVSVTHGLVDFYSAGDTHLPFELNMWYHTLNCGFKTPISGETDFPCITDLRVGLARSYFKSEGAVNYDDYVAAIKSGRSYVTEGRAHLMNFKINGIESGTNNNEIRVNGKQRLDISVDVAAYMPEYVNDSNAMRPESSRVFWNIETARIDTTTKVRLELIVNARPVDTVEVRADGSVKKINFKYDADRSCWAAVRILGAAHSNPLFITIDNKKIYEPESAEWCMKAVDQCWLKKEPNIRSEEKADAKEAYDKARKIYEDLARQDK